MYLARLTARETAALSRLGRSASEGGTLREILDRSISDLKEELVAAQEEPHIRRNQGAAKALMELRKLLD